MTQVHRFLSQFRAAETITERQAVADDYLHYFSTLSESEQRQARQIMQPLRADIQITLDELDRLSEEAERVLGAKTV